MANAQLISDHGWIKLFKNVSKSGRRFYTVSCTVWSMPSRVERSDLTLHFAPNTVTHASDMLHRRIFKFQTRRRAEELIMMALLKWGTK